MRRKRRRAGAPDFEGDLLSDQVGGFSGEDDSPGGAVVREATVLRLLVALLVLVVGIQVCLRFEPVRRQLNASIRLEGDPLSRAVQGLEQEAYPWLEWPPPDASSDPSSWATLYLRFMGSRPEEAWVLVNGTVAKRLGPDGGTITVRAGNEIEVYVPNGEVSVVVSASTPNLVEPPLGTWVVGKGTVRIGVVSLK